MSLSDALRAAALERAARDGQNVDGIVIEPNGVIDLRAMVRQRAAEVTPTRTLPSLNPRPSDGVDSETRPLTQTALWRRLRPPSEPEVDLTGPDTVLDLTAMVDAVCDHCGSDGRRDLFDRDTGTEFFLCPDCGHMWDNRSS